jgi:hypothetical protein
VAGGAAGGVGGAGQGDMMELLVVILTIATMFADHFSEKDTRFSKNRWYPRARHLRRLLVVLVAVVAYGAGQSATRAQQAEVQAQRRQLDGIAKNIETIAGKLGITLPTPRTTP